MLYICPRVARIVVTLDFAKPSLETRFLVRGFRFVAPAFKLPLPCRAPLRVGFLVAWRAERE
jgi:hypothetical protein